MKYLKYFLIAGFSFIMLASTTTKNTKPSEGIYPGDLFPIIKNLKDKKGTELNLSDLRGQKVLVNFWAAYDAQSHLENVLMTKKIQQAKSSVRMISVSFDESEAVFEKTIAMDRIDISNQYRLDSECQKDLKKRYRLEKGFKSYLIDENGEILAMNLNSQNIEKYLN